jgi:hypothetical protein
MKQLQHRLPCCGDCARSLLPRSPPSKAKAAVADMASCPAVSLSNTCHLSDGEVSAKEGECKAEGKPWSAFSRGGLAGQASGFTKGAREAGPMWSGLH